MKFYNGTIGLAIGGALIAIVIAYIFMQHWTSFVQFSNKTGGIASWIGLLIAVVGFIVTICRVVIVGRIAQNARQQIESTRTEFEQRTDAIRVDTKTTFRRMALQVVSKTVDDVLRFLRELREASQSGEWLRAIDKCSEARFQIKGLLVHPHLTKEEQTSMRSSRFNLATIVQYMEQYKLNDPNAKKALPQQKTKVLERIASGLDVVYERLQKQIWEDGDVD